MERPKLETRQWKRWFPCLFAPFFKKKRFCLFSRGRIKISNHSISVQILLPLVFGSVKEKCSLSKSPPLWNPKKSPRGGVNWTEILWYGIWKLKCHTFHEKSFGSLRIFYRPQIGQKFHLWAQKWALKSPKNVNFERGMSDSASKIHLLYTIFGGSWRVSSTFRKFLETLPVSNLPKIPLWGSDFPNRQKTWIFALFSHNVLLWYIYIIFGEFWKASSVFRRLLDHPRYSTNLQFRLWAQKCPKWILK